MPKLRNDEGSAAFVRAEPVPDVEPTPENPYIVIRTGNPEYDAALREACARWLAAQKNSG